MLSQLGRAWQQQSINRCPLTSSSGGPCDRGNLCRHQAERGGAGEARRPAKSTILDAAGTVGIFATDRLRGAGDGQSAFAGATARLARDRFGLVGAGPIDQGDRQVFGLCRARTGGRPRGLGARVEGQAQAPRLSSITDYRNIVTRPRHN